MLVAFTAPFFELDRFSRLPVLIHDQNRQAGRQCYYPLTFVEINLDNETHCGICGRNNRSGAAISSHIAWQKGLRTDTDANSPTTCLFTVRTCCEVVNGSS